MISSAVAVADVATASQYNNLRRDVVCNAGDYAVTTGAANTYAVTVDASYTAYVTGSKIRAKINVSSTGASTLNANGLGAKSIVKNGSLAIGANDLVANQIYEFTYDGTNLQLTNAGGDALEVINAVTYNAYGNITAIDTPSADLALTYENPFQRISSFIYGGITFTVNRNTLGQFTSLS